MKFICLLANFGSKLYYFNVRELINVSQLYWIFFVCQWILAQSQILFQCQIIQNLIFWFLVTKTQFVATCSVFMITIPFVATYWAVNILMSLMSKSVKIITSLQICSTISWFYDIAIESKNNINYLKQSQKFAECWTNPFWFWQNNLQQSSDSPFFQCVCELTPF